MNPRRITSAERRALLVARDTGSVFNIFDATDDPRGHGSRRRMIRRLMAGEPDNLIASVPGPKWGTITDMGLAALNA